MTRPPKPRGTVAARKPRKLQHKPQRVPETSGLRESILAAARELFIELGYEATTMRKIAEHIGYSATTLYLHFADKNAIMAELCHRDFAELAARSVEVMAEPDPVVRLGRLGKAYTEFGLRNPNHYRLMFMTRKTDVQAINASPEWADVKGDPGRDAYALLVATVRDAMQAGALRDDLKDPEMVGQMLWASLHGLVSLYLDHCKDDWMTWRPVRSLADGMLRMILGGVVKPSLHARYMGGA
jgi:AcrR family transcriptional regulator